MVVMFYNLQAADVLSLSLTLVLTENGKWSTDSTALDRGDVELVVIFDVLPFQNRNIL